MPNHETPAPTAVWVDGDPLMEAIAAAVWEQCGRSDSGSCVEDDPRTIAAVAAAVSVPPPATRADDLRWAAELVAADTAHIRYGSATDYANRHAALLRRAADDAQGPCVAGEQQNETPEAEAEFAGTQPCGHDDYHDGHEWADRPGVWCPGIGYDEEA